jgi:hypothetical protein
LVKCTGALLDNNNFTILATCRLWTTILLGLAPLRSRVPAPRDLAHMQMMVTINYCNAWGAKCILMHDDEYSTAINSYSYFTNLPLAFLFINNLTSH